MALMGHVNVFAVKAAFYRHLYEMIGALWRASTLQCDGANTDHRGKARGKRGGERRSDREVAQQVVHTARWVPGAWRGWLRYQTARTRGGGQNISSEHQQKKTKGRQRWGLET